MERRDPESLTDELALLSEFLDYHRATLVMKVSGLTQDQLAVRLGPSTLTLAVLVKHMALVEDGWFHDRLVGHDLPEPWASADFGDDPDWDFHSAVHDSPAELLDLYAAACERSRAAVAEVGGDLLATMVRPTRRGERFNLRWILLHMIEETARHNGHADLLRESIDGETGE
jgi:uncharacterized damage-inducible protein DinB